MTQCLKRLWIEEKAQNLPEYSLLLILVCLTAVSAVGTMAAKVNNIYSNAGTHVSTANNNPSLAGGSFAYTSKAPANPQSWSNDGKQQKPTQSDR